MNRTEASLAHTPATFAGMSRRAQSIVLFLLVLGLCNWHLDRGFNANTLSRAAMVAAALEAQEGEADEDSEDEDEDEESEFYTEDELSDMTISELRSIAKDNGIETRGMKKGDLIEALL